MLSASAVPETIGVLTRVRRSLPDAPLSDAEASASIAGLAGAAVSMVSTSAAEAALALPAGSVALAVNVCAPSVNVAQVNDQRPEASALALPSSVPPS